MLSPARPQFHMEQAKLRASRRLREGRPRPVDTLVRTLHLAQDFGVDPDPPYAAFEKLGLLDLRDLQDNIHQLQVRSCACAQTRLLYLILRLSPGIADPDPPTRPSRS